MSQPTGKTLAMPLNFDAKQQVLLRAALIHDLSWLVPSNESALNLINQNIDMLASVRKSLESQETFTVYCAGKAELVHRAMEIYAESCYEYDGTDHTIQRALANGYGGLLGLSDYCMKLVRMIDALIINNQADAPTNPPEQRLAAEDR